MTTLAAQPQTNGVPGTPSGGNSQTLVNTQSTAAPATQPQAVAPGNNQQPPSSPSAVAPRPRDARMIELLLTSQGVTAYDSRVPLLLMDFAYRHTSSVLSDSLHLSADPYTTHAGAKPSASAGASATLIGGDATVSANAIRLAIASRLGYQFRGGNTSGGLSKEWLQEIAHERNKVALPKIPPNEWAVRLPSEKYVLSGLSWGLKGLWEDAEEAEDEDMVEGGPEGGAMEGVESTTNAEDIGGDGVEGGTIEDVFGEDIDEDMEGEG